MVEEMVESLVLQDGNGTWYLLPRAVLNQHVVPEELRARVEQCLVEGEVEGYGMGTYRLLGVIVAAGLVAQGAALRPVPVRGEAPTARMAESAIAGAGPARLDAGGGYLTPPLVGGWPQLPVVC
jgi:hypothetical protein